MPLNLHLITIDEADNWYDIAASYYAKGNYSAAIDAFTSAWYVYELHQNWQLWVKLANDIAECYFNDGLPAQGYHYTQIALQTAQLRLNPTDFDYVNCYYVHGLYFKTIEDYNQCLTFLNKGLEEAKLHLTEMPDIIAQFNYSLAGVNTRKGNHKEAQNYYKSAIEIYSALLGPEHNHIAACFFSIAVSYLYCRDYQMGLLYLQKGITIYQKNNAPPLHLAFGYNNIAGYYINTNQYAEALTYYKKSLSLKINIFGAKHPEITFAYRKIGSVLESMGCVKKALQYLHKSLQAPNNNYANSFNTYRLVGNCLAQKKHYKKAIFFYEKALTIGEANFGSYHPQTAAIYQQIAQIQSQTAVAITTILQTQQKALLSLGNPQIQFSSLWQLPPISEYQNEAALLEVLSAKAHFLWLAYTQCQQQQQPQPIDNQLNYLVAALAHYQCADELVSQIRQSFRTEDSKLLLAHTAKNMYAHAVLACFEAQNLIQTTKISGKINLQTVATNLGYVLNLNPTELAFHFFEKSKANLLLASFKESEAKINANIPDELQASAYNLQVELNYLEKTINETKQKVAQQTDAATIEKLTAKLTELQSVFFDAKQSFDHLITTFETQYPDYYLLKYQTQPIGLSQLLTTIPPNELLITYQVTNDYLYIFAVTRGKYQFYRQNYASHLLTTAQLTDAIEDFLLFGIQDRIKTDFETLGYELYDLLLAGVLADFNPSPNSLLRIIPDDILAKLPFELLLTSPSSAKPYAALPYLVRQYAVSYHYSATLWHNQAKKQSYQAAAEPSFVGFAPVYYNLNNNINGHNTADNNIGLPPLQTNEQTCVALPYSEVEVMAISEVFTKHRIQTQTVLHQQATINQFKQLAQHYKYLHIAG
nr:tetratricopeptide repeat protein [Chitinophagales bacterium]